MRDISYFCDFSKKKKKGKETPSSEENAPKVPTASGDGPNISQGYNELLILKAPIHAALLNSLLQLRSTFSNYLERRSRKRKQIMLEIRKHL